MGLKTYQENGKESENGILPFLLSLVLGCSVGYLLILDLQGTVLQEK